jgi:hypothetical protein
VLVVQEEPQVSDCRLRVDFVVAVARRVWKTELSGWGVSVTWGLVVEELSLVRFN